MRIQILARAELAGGALTTDAEASVGDPRRVDRDGISLVTRR
jgi:hypothetical protein